MLAAAGRKPSHRRRSVWISVLIAVILLAGASAAWYFLAGPGVAAAQTGEEGEEAYQTATARRGSLRNSITGSGTLVAGSSVDLSFATGGLVEELDVAAGQAVTTGQVLAKLGNTEALEAAVAAAEVSTLQARQDLTDLQQNADVALAQAYSDYVAAKSAVSTAQSTQLRTTMSRCSADVNTRYAAELERAKEKLAKQPEGTELYTDARNDYDTALANSQYCLGYTDDEKTSASADADLAENSLELAEQKYEQLKAASGVDPDQLALAELTLKEAETKLTEAKETLAGATLVAPIDGVITYLAASEGEIVGTDLFLTISNLDQPSATVQIDETDLPMFVVGSPVEVVFDALPDDLFTGTLVQVDPELTTSFNVRTAGGLIQLDASAADRLRPYPLGLNGTVEVIAGQVEDAVLVPSEAVRDLGGQNAVFVLTDGQLKLRVVETGLSDGTYTAITSGLNAGEVVSTGNIATGSN